MKISLRCVDYMLRRRPTCEAAKNYAAFFAARIFAHLFRCASAIALRLAADILRPLVLPRLFRPFADSAAKVLPKALTAAASAFNCRSASAFTFVSFRASFCKAASKFIRTLPARKTTPSLPKRKAEEMTVSDGESRLAFLAVRPLTVRPVDKWKQTRVETSAYCFYATMSMLIKFSAG